MEAADHGIGVTIIYPPDTQTPFLDYEHAHTLPECRALSAGAKALTPEQLANRFVTAIQKNRFEVMCGPTNRAILALKTLWPSLYYFLIDRAITKDRRLRL